MGWAGAFAGKGFAPTALGGSCPEQEQEEPPQAVTASRLPLALPAGLGVCSPLGPGVAEDHTPAPLAVLGDPGATWQSFPALLQPQAPKRCH